MMHRPFTFEEPSLTLARVVLVAAPILAYDALLLGGITKLALLLPLGVLVAAFIRSPTANVPGWQLLMTTVIALSVLWSDDSAYTAERLRTYLPLLAITLVATALLDSRTILRCLELSFTLIVASTLVVLLLNPSTRYRGDEFILQAQFAKNDYGAVLAFALALALARRRRLNVAIFPVLLVLIVLNRSVTAWVVSVFLVALVLTGRWVSARIGPREGRPVLVVVGIAATIAVVLFLSHASAYAFRVVGKDPSLSRRTDIWAACWEQIKAAPLLGHGAFDFLNAASGSPVTRAIWAQFGVYKPPHPHNGLLDVWGQLGLLGVVVFVGLMVFGFTRGARGATAGSVPSLAALLGLLYVVMFGLTEPTYLGPSLVLVFMCVGMTHQAEYGRVRNGSRAIAEVAS